MTESGSMSRGSSAPLLGLLERSGRIGDFSGLPGLLGDLEKWSRQRGLPAGFCEEAVRGALMTADPRSALVRLARLLVSVEDPNFMSLLEDKDGLRSLLAILGYSGFLSALIMRSPGDYIWLMRQVGLSEARSMPQMQAELSERLNLAMPMDEVRQALRRNKYREMLRIGVRDLLGRAALEETVLEISALAETSVDAAVEMSAHSLRERHGVPLQVGEDGVRRPCKFSVLGLGKLGGGELNYSSDVDLFYLYSSHQGMTTGRPSVSGGYRDAVENHRFFVRLGELVTGLLNDRTSDGIVFRVDLRLRPEGESGEIAYSIPSLEVYYQSWGRTADRLALLKARPVGGDRRLGEEYLDLMTPFVYRRHLDYNALEEVGLLKEKIDRHASAKGSGGFDVKLGRGGIREIEFLVQSLQLIHGGRNPAIRERNTLRALERLMRNGFLGERDSGSLAEAYRFLRDVEHKLQLVEERQTQVLPKGTEDLERLAFTLGFVRDGLPDAASFHARMEKTTGAVMAQFDRLFAAGRVSVPSAELEAAELLPEGMTEEEAVSHLRAMGFADGEAAYRNLAFLRDGPPQAHFSETCRHLLRQIAPRLLAEIRAVPDPDAALMNLVRFIGRVGARASYYSMLADHPDSIRLLSVLFGTSSFLSALLVRQPDLLDIMVGGTDLAAVKQGGEMAEEVAGLLRSSPSFEDELMVLRRYRNGEVLRVGLGDLLGLKDLAAIHSELSSLADALLDASCRLALREAAGGGEAAGEMAVVAMGKMGGREMNYSSDLDLIFLYEGDERARAFCTKAAQRTITVLNSPTAEGVLYRVDMRLRPSGHAGPLVTSLDSFVRYHIEEAMVWERQALVKARCVAGPDDFRRRIAGTLEQLAYQRPLAASDLEEIMAVRRRMESEIAGEEAGNHFDIKAGPGGLVDIEFAVQALLLAHGRGQPRVRSTTTLEALKALAETGLVDEKSYNVFRRAYVFFREIENRSQIYSDRSDPKIPAHEEKVQPLARRLGYLTEGRSAGDFLDELTRTREVVRAAYLKIMELLLKELK